MSLDLYQDETRERISSMPPVSVPEAGAFDGFVRGTALATMRGLAGAASGIDILGGAIARIQDKVLGTGTEAQDRYFREHDDVFGSAVDAWTPAPNEVGAAADIVGGMLSTLPLVIVNPSLAVAATQAHAGEELVRKGVSPEKAGAVGAVQGLGLGLGVWMPILGQNLWQRVFVGGAAGNALQGIVTRGASQAILDGTPAGDEFKAFDGKSMTLDVLLGMAFGSLAHLSPGQRDAGAKYWERLTTWAQNLDPSQVDAVATLRQAQHLNVDSAPGNLEDPQDVQSHVDRVKAAIDQLEKGAPVGVDDLPAPKFEADEARSSAAQKNLAELEKTAEKVSKEEGISALPTETEAPAVKPAATQPPPPRGEPLVEAAGAEAKPGEAKPVDPVVLEAQRIAAEQPDLALRVGADADGKPVTMTAQQFVDDAIAGAAKIREQAKLLAVAAQCLLGVL